MKELTTKIERAVSEAVPKLRSLPEPEFSRKESPLKWSKKETLGHLVDSAQNNIQRFVRSQYKTTPTLVYDQNEWVRLQNYEHYPTEELLPLWVVLNKHLCRVLEAIPADDLYKTCNVGKELAEEHTLLFLAEDYLSHLRHHLSQIVE
ncbi:DinB family protein [Telluribacter sp.]|jgi:hypothetical protein|uniref:DinB family protein n=1 Tax=Telluribacter sp. TaxID=1978767 RepID=UPI002E16873F|nr:DinB family protein [Telluribacter sp.]